MRVKRVDVNQAEIVAEFRRLGWEVIDMHEFGHGFPDLIIARVYSADEGTCSWQHYLVEVKAPRGKYTPDQVEFNKRFGGLAVTVKSVEQVKELFG